LSASAAASFPYWAAIWLLCQYIADKGLKGLLCVFIHDDCHCTHIQPILLGGQALSESISDMVRAEQGGNHDSDLSGYEGETDDVPRFEDLTFDTEIVGFTSG
jgi:hypothetical protein